MKDLKLWLTEAISKTKTTGLYSGVHLDEIIDYEGVRSNKSKILTNCHEVFVSVVNYITNNEIDTLGVGIFLTVDLMGDSTSLSRLPESINELVEIIDDFAIPELLIYQQQPYESIPLIEIYRIPMLYEQLNVNEHIHLFYKETRAVEEINKGEYLRELNFVYHR